MLVREVKLKPTAKQRASMDECLWRMVSVYNTALVKCWIGLTSGRIPSPFDLGYEFKGHGKKSGMNQNAIWETCNTARNAFDRWLKKDASGARSGRPRRKSLRNKVKSITYGQSSKITKPNTKRVNVPGFGKVRCSKNQLPVGVIKGGRLVKRASGYYFQFMIDTEHKQETIPNAPCVGIDPGFKTLLTLSDGVKFENPRELRKAEQRLAQAQRGKNKKLAGRIHERLKRQRADRSHKISHEIVKNYSEIFVSDDSLKGMAKTFGKSVAEAGLGRLLNMVAYKALSSGRRFVRVNSKNTTRACSACQSLTGPTGLSMLAVREWSCNSCGASHDRDINAAQNALLSGQGMPSSAKVFSVA